MFHKVFTSFSYNLTKLSPGTCLINTRWLSVGVEDFEKAKSRLNKLKNDPGSEQKLKIYALFKQATDGKCNKPKPGMMNFVDRAKWDAWNSLGDMKKEEAIQSYISIVDGLVKDQGLIEEKGNLNTSTSGGPLNVTNVNGVLKIELNRPEKKNALTWEMYKDWTELLRKANDDESVRVVVVTGSGDYFCSGNDLANFSMLQPNETLQGMAKRGKEILQNFVGSFIDCSKPLIALINGPAIGISVTTLGLYDAVFASDKATFSTPFTNLGQTPEGCSSLMFPKVLGPMKANQMLMFNQKLSAHVAQGLVSQVIPHASFLQETSKLVSYVASLPPQSLAYSKQLIRGPLREQMHKTNQAECERLQERWLSDECVKAITAFFSKNKAA